MAESNNAFCVSWLWLGAHNQKKKKHMAFLCGIFFDLVVKFFACVKICKTSIISWQSYLSLGFLMLLLIACFRVLMGWAR
jgi:hypothetical protein